MVRCHPAAGTARLLRFIALLLCAAAMHQAADAQPIVISGGLDLTQNYRPDAPQTLRFDLRNESDRAIEGTVVVPLTSDTAPATIKLPAIVPPRSIVRVRMSASFTRVQIDSKKKQSDVPPLATAEFRTTGGAVLSRTPFMGLPITSKSGQGDQEKGELILLVKDRADDSPERDIESLASLLSDKTEVPLAIATIELRVLARDPQALRSVKAVVLEGVDPADVDVGQREALTTYLRGGGVIVLPAPSIPSVRAGDWFKQLLPVEIIGTRQATQIAVSVNGPSLKLQRPLEIIEALDAGGDALLRDRDYVHVSEKRIGLGKVVFTSFPINAVDPAQPEVVRLWTRLFALDRPQWEWNRTQLAAARHSVLGSMIGRKVAPWSVAAALAGGYLAIILIAQLIFTGPTRPRAVAVSLGAAMLTSIFLVGMGITRHADQSLQSARLSILDIAPDGGGWRTESSAYLGIDDSNLTLKSTGEHVTITPALAAASNRPTIRQDPFAAENAGVFSERIERVWEASAPVDPSMRLAVTATATPGGLSLDIDNQLNQPIESPLVIVGGRALAISDVPPGKSTVRQFHLNPHGQFTSTSAIASDLAKRRAQIIAASLAPAGGGELSHAPMLVAWIASPGTPLLSTDATVAETKSMTLVRTPLRFQLPAPGSAVTIDRALTKLDTGQLPYEHDKGESVPTPQTGSWPIIFSAPRELGIVKPTRITVSARISLPAHTLRFTLGGATGEWNRTTGVIEKTFDCTPADIDPAGRVRVTLEIESRDPTGSAPWQIADLSARIEGSAAGPATLIEATPQKETR